MRPGCRPYRYDECGLDNLILVGLEIYEDDGGESAVTIRNINGLHRAIVEGIARKPTGITGRELRFVRTELGLTQAELAGVVTKDDRCEGGLGQGLGLQDGEPDLDLIEP